MAAFPKYTALNVTTATGLVIKKGPGVLGGVSINKVTVGTVTIKDGGTTIATIAAATPGGMYLQGPASFASLNVSMSTAAEDVTFLYE